MRPILLLLCALIGYTAAFTLDCRFGMTSYPYVSTQYYSCRRDNITAALDREDRFVDDITGQHTSGKSHNDVTGIYLTGGRMYFFPRGFERFFRNLRVISAERMSILEIRSRDLRPYVDLEYLYLPQNMIEVLEVDLFRYNTKLRGISFEDNRLRFVHDSVFDGVARRLEFIHMEHAGCVDTWTTVDMQTAVDTIKNKCSAYDNFAALMTDLYFAQRYRQVV